MNTFSKPKDEFIKNRIKFCYTSIYVGDMYTENNKVNFEEEMARNHISVILNFSSEKMNLSCVEEIDFSNENELYKNIRLVLLALKNNKNVFLPFLNKEGETSVILAYILIYFGNYNNKKDNKRALNVVKAELKEFLTEEQIKQINDINKKKDIFNEIINFIGFDPKNEKEKLKAIEYNPTNIKYVKDIPEDVVFKVIKKDGRLIRYIKDPTEEMQLEAIRQEPNSIKWIKNPSEKIKLEVVKLRGSSIQFINNPTEEMQLEAIKQSETAIRYIYNPSEEVQLEAIKHNSHNIGYIYHPTENVKREALKKDISCIKHIDLLTKELQIEVIRQSNYDMRVIMLCPDWVDLKKEISEEMLVKKMLG